MTGLFSIVSALMLLACVRLQIRRFGRFGIVAPSTIFFCGVFARYGLGSLIIWLTPKDWVLTGEYSQYLVTWKFIDETSRIWMLYMVFAGLSYVGIEMVSGRWVKKIIEEGKGWLGKKGVGLLRLSGDARVLTVVLLLIFLAESIVGLLTGSTDRGSSYEYWASQSFKPVSGFVALSRLRQIAFLLLPVALVSCKRLTMKLALVGTGASTLLIGFIAGGRGTVLYPLVMAWVGWVLIGAKKKNVMALTLALVMGLGLSIPAIAVYRDSSIIRTTSSDDVIGRLSGMVRGFDIAQYKYRVQALGREIYACSDSFLFLERNKELRDSGFRDLDLGLISKVVLPRFLAADSGFEKNDGAIIAKKSIGVVNPTWFPCISTPGDLWRRGGYGSVCNGGLVMGTIIGFLQVSWTWIGCKAKGLFSLLIVLFPASYIHYGLYGTVRELIWQLGWELPKYIVSLIIISTITRIKSLSGPH